MSFGIRNLFLTVMGFLSIHDSQQLQFFQGWCSHSWKERVDTTQRGFQVFIFIDICFFSSDVSFPYYVCFVRKMSLYDFQRSATSSRLLLWRCRGHPPTWGWSQLNITWSRFVSNMVKYDHHMSQIYFIDQDNWNNNSRQVKWDSPSQDSLAIDRSR